MIGYLFIYIKDSTNKILVRSLAFASGVMLLISVVDLIPNSFSLISNRYFILPAILLCAIFVVGGIVMSMLIDKYLPDNSYNDSSLYRVGFVSMLAIFLHNVPEGIATFLASNHDVTLGITLAISIALHNIPEGISVSVPIYYSTGSKKKAFLYTMISGMSEFFGAIFASIFLLNFSNDFFMGCLYSLIAGIMIHISVYELLPASLKYKRILETIIFFVIGILFMGFSIIVLH